MALLQKWSWFLSSIITKSVSFLECQPFLGLFARPEALMFKTIFLSVTLFTADPCIAPAVAGDGDFVGGRLVPGQ